MTKWKNVFSELWMDGEWTAWHNFLVDERIIDGEIIESGVVRDERGRLVSGVLNPKGKPKGATSYKTFVRDFLLSLSEEKKMEYLQQMVDRGEFLDAWKMAEGNPHSTEDVKHTIAPQPIMAISQVASTTLSLPAEGESPTMLP